MGGCIHIFGTGKGVGKSVVANGLYRILHKSGFDVRLSRIDTRVQGGASPCCHNEHTIAIVEYSDIPPATDSDKNQDAAFLVTDNDRGDLYATTYGTIALLPPARKSAIKGLILNKWHGEAKDAATVSSRLQELTGIPVVCVVPFMNAWDTDTLNPWGTLPRPLEAAVIHLPEADLAEPAVLGLHPAFTIRIVEHPDKITDPDLVILPDAKNPAAALHWLRRICLDSALCSAMQSGTPIMGIGSGGGVLDAISVSTQRPAIKTTKRAAARSTPTSLESIPVTGRINTLTGIFSCLAGMEFSGRITTASSTTVTFSDPYFASIQVNGQSIPEGKVDGNMLATTIHGLFESAILRNKLAGELVFRKGLDENTSSAKADDRDDPVTSELKKVLAHMPAGKLSLR